MWATSSVFSLCIKLSRSLASGTWWCSVWHGFPHLAVQHYSQKASGRNDVFRNPVGRACWSMCWFSVSSWVLLPCTFVEYSFMNGLKYYSCQLGALIWETCQQWLLKMPRWFPFLQVWTCSNSSSSGDILF